MQAEQQAVLDSITTQGLPQMLPAVEDAPGPVYKFLRGWL
jgi:hypothetical protein